MDHTELRTKDSPSHGLGRAPARPVPGWQDAPGQAVRV